MTDSRSARNLNNRLIDYLKLGQEYLDKKGIEESRLKTERLLCHLLEMDRVGLYMNFDRPLSNGEVDALRNDLKRVAMGEPLQYVVGHAGFYNLEFIVHPGVLVPRPETELMIDLAKKEAPEDGFRSTLDVGCGSGCISISTLEEGITANLTAIDVSPSALYVTYLNAVKHGYLLPPENHSPESENDFQQLIETNSNSIVMEKVCEESTRKLTLYLMDAFNNPPTPPGQPFDLILSNPPYITQADYDQLPDHIRNHEPEVALRSGQDGLDAHRSLASTLQNWLDKGGLFYGEIGADQKEAIEAIYGKNFQNVHIVFDLNHLPRVIHLQKP